LKADRELLELAAKAAGNGAQWDCPERGMMVLSASGTDTTSWNPLTSDGDALRLAVKLRLHIGLESHTVSAWGNDDFGNFMTERHADRGDEAGTRRAIVRAAAYIGERMQ
jgi:hypothetical protein